MAKKETKKNKQREEFAELYGKEFLEVLKKEAYGKENSIKAPYFMDLLGVNLRNLAYVVEGLKNRGKQIGACKKGYYFIVTEKEKEENIRRGLKRGISALYANAKPWQMTMSDILRKVKEEWKRREKESRELSKLRVT